MKLSTFEKQQYAVPFLSDPIGHNQGLDQLGLNLTGERIFDLLLPGLNNVTNRVRYYSFYCWFFDWYATTISDLNHKTQIKYLRRAEFLLALISAVKHSQGVPGITKGLEVFYEEEENIELEKGTQEKLGKTTGSYWKYRTGIFGQYYAASVRTIGLIKSQDDNESIYIRTAFEIEGRISGLSLANAFKENIGKENESLFFEIVKRQWVTKSQLKILSEPFNMVEVPSDSTENRLLVQLLLGPDKVTLKENTYYRRDTIDSILKDLKEDTVDSYAELQLPWRIYTNNDSINLKKNVSSPLWYVFLMEQLWSIVCTGTLSHFLNYLLKVSSDAWMEEEKLIADISSKVAKNLIEKGGINSFEESLDKNSSFSEEDLANQILKNHDSIEAIGCAIILLQKILFKNYKLRDHIVQFGSQYGLFTRSSFTIVMQDLNSKVNYDLEKFIKYFLTKYVLYRHHYVALRKMTENQSTNKFVREDGLIRYIDNFNFGFSSPRINTLLNFLTNLDLIEVNNKQITPKGLKTLKNLNNAI